MMPRGVESGGEFDVWTWTLDVVEKKPLARPSMRSAFSKVRPGVEPLVRVSRENSIMTLLFLD